MRPVLSAYEKSGMHWQRLNLSRQIRILGVMNQENWVKCLAERTVLISNHDTLGMKHEVIGVIHEEFKKKTI